ncbi:hypothetical protein [Parasphingorhabdus halotolerans]|uniref:Uncharacterized protein n=1 Tax=Parasphingorhabdus halotolerans TaxID=2725558 RepID=A0A6H2DQK2_9SPHN|nr:hypothetical protein [Parasphingorhabdus halotolerans]QJB70478.1 hypothetical protein HF685_15425 [Parasphingorhabdus halotolerans]
MLSRVKKLPLLAIGGMIFVLAGCQVAAPPPPAVAPPIVYTPRAPTPPFNASSNTLIPPLRVDGMRQTINRDIGPLETLWHVRAALNVAALSCTGPAYARIVDDYNAFINKNEKFLRNANNSIISKYRREIGNDYKAEHDRHQTSLYNYWSFSPLRRPFCDQSVLISERAVATSTGDLETFGAQALAELERPFTEFYLAYEQYERDLDAWRRQYAPEQYRDARDETINTEGLTGNLVQPDERENPVDLGIIEPPTGN